MPTEQADEAIDFWFDPTCPLSRITARWVRSVASQRPVRVRWRVMSLSILNEGKDVDPEGDEHGYLWIPARVCAAVQTEHGHDALGEFYDSLWTERPESARQQAGDLTEALSAAGLPTSLAMAGHSTVYDKALRASHDDAMRLVRGESGSPITAITDADDSRRAVHGPVITEPTAPDDALRLWDGLRLVTAVPGFTEIKS